MSKYNLVAGQDIYVTSAMFISRGSDDRVGGLAKIKSIDEKNNRVVVEEFPNIQFGLDSLMKQQEELKITFGDNRAYPDPDVDQPWIQDGDTVNGHVYHGPDII